MTGFLTIRDKIRTGSYTGHTSNLCDDYAQFNVVVIPSYFADDFFLFCRNNSVACPLVLKTNAGEKIIPQLGNVNICTDIPQYQIYRHAVMVEERTDISDIWQDDFVTFIVGCSFTFEHAIMHADIPLLHVEQNKNVAMYRTNIPMEKTQYFSGNMVVSMRWIEQDNIEKVIHITKQYPNFHGAPIHIGNPEEIGITHLESPDFGDYVSPTSSHMQPVFWGCGVSTQMVLENEQIPIAITHKPGCMLIGNLNHHEILQSNFLTAS